jgi:CPA2 family monovalent cation:H+ antiporter-2
MESIEEAGADTVVPESLESSLIVAAITLENLNVDHEEVQRLIEKARDDHYQRLRGVIRGNDIQT